MRWIHRGSHPAAERLARGCGGVGETEEGVSTRRTGFAADRPEGSRGERAPGSLGLPQGSRTPRRPGSPSPAATRSASPGATRFAARARSRGRTCDGKRLEEADSGQNLPCVEAPQELAQWEDPDRPIPEICRAQVDPVTAGDGAPFDPAAERSTRV